MEKANDHALLRRLLDYEGDLALVRGLLEQVALDDPEHWATTEGRVRALLAALEVRP